MPYNEYGTPFNTGTQQFISLKSKGDKIRFRLLGAPFVDGKHFSQNADDSWTITPCPRINDKQECEICKKYFSIIMPAKKTGDKEALKTAQKDAKKYQVSVSFYFPVINRDTAEFAIFNSRSSVKSAIDAELAMGTKVLEVDWIVLRTEIPGKYYTVKVVDSKDTPPLTEEELEEVEKYKKMDLSQIVSGTRDEESGLAVEANIEVEKDPTDDFVGGKK